jgi:hypothetical protein
LDPEIRRENAEKSSRKGNNDRYATVLTSLSARRDSVRGQPEFRYPDRHNLLCGIVLRNVRHSGWPEQVGRSAFQAEGDVNLDADFGSRANMLALA